MLRPQENRFVNSTPVEDNPNANFIDYTTEDYDLSTWTDACPLCNTKHAENASIPTLPPDEQDIIVSQNDAVPPKMPAPADMSEEPSSEFPAQAAALDSVPQDITEDASEDIPSEEDVAQIPEISSVDEDAYPILQI